MLLGGPGPDGSDPGFETQGAIFYEVRSVGQKSNGMLEQLFVRPTMAVLEAAADGSLYAPSRAPAGRTSPSATASPAAADRAEHECGWPACRAGHPRTACQPANAVTKRMKR